MIIKRRLRKLSIIFVLVLLMLTGKLISIQLVKGDEYKEMASKQYTASLSGLHSRGEIYDRNGNHLTGIEENFIFLLEKRRMDDRARTILEEAEAIEVNDNNEKYHVFSICSMDRDLCSVLCGEYGALVVKSKERYSRNQPAVHMIGYVNHADGTGACGLEKDYDEILSSLNREYYGQIDGLGYLIPGMGISIKGDSHEWGIVTTLDKELQQMAEQLLNSQGMSGAIIVTDTEGEILVSASSPVFNPYDIEEYLESDKKEFLNKATQCQYPPGSVFKIVVMAAALEKGIINPDSIFECKGYHEIGNHRIRCSTGGEHGHGHITVQQAFADSCNSVFIQIGQMVGADEIIKMARSFGITAEAVNGLSGQLVGHLPTNEQAYGAGIGNLSIGQGQLLVTPMQIARMTKIIACGGMDNGLDIVAGVLKGEEGFEKQQKTVPKRVISDKTAEIIGEMMYETVLNGTADNLRPITGTTAAGKTGSADAVEGANRLVHSWFTGFMPAEAPEYVITVFVENGGSGRKSAVPVFQKMMELIESSHN